MEFQPNRTIGPYVLISLLGRGAFGEVWLARHHDLGEERAVKIPTDPHFIQQLRREGKLIYGLCHENIVQGHDVNTLNDPPYVAMEFVRGVSLRQKLKTTGRLEEPEAVRIVREILAALAYAHEHGVLHRDLKPENVLLNASGVAKLADFGLGKVQAEIEQTIMMSGSLGSSEGRSISGTIEYMSPQQKAGEEPDPRDDIYAVGVIACEMLTGSRPMPVGIGKMLQRAGVDMRLAPVLENAMECERAERFPTAKAMADALASALSGGVPSTAAAQPMPPSPGVMSPPQISSDARWAVSSSQRQTQPNPLLIPSRAPLAAPAAVLSYAQPPRGATRGSPFFFLASSTAAVALLSPVPFIAPIFLRYDPFHFPAVPAVMAVMGAVFWLISAHLGFTSVYWAWVAVQPLRRINPAYATMPTPPVAMVLLFIPIINLLWLFVAYGSLMRFANQLAKARGIDCERFPVELGNAAAAMSALFLALIWVPVLDSVLFAVSMTLFYLLVRQAQRIVQTVDA